MQSIYDSSVKCEAQTSQLLPSFGEALTQIHQLNQDLDSSQSSNGYDGSYSRGDVDMEETCYEKTCFHNMLMERSSHSTYPAAQYGEQIKSDEFPHPAEEESSDLKMEHDMYHNDTYQGYYHQQAYMSGEAYGQYQAQQVAYPQPGYEAYQYSSGQYMYPAQGQAYGYNYPAQYDYGYQAPCEENTPEAPQASQSAEMSEKEELLRALRKIANDDELVIKSTDKVGKGFNKPSNGFRGSKYRGVSRNGNQWQVLIMVNKKKRYIGTISDEEEAARIYDKAAIQNHGMRANTNFDYTKRQVIDILNEPALIANPVPSLVRKASFEDKREWPPVDTSSSLHQYSLNNYCQAPSNPLVY